MASRKRQSTRKFWLLGSIIILIAGVAAGFYIFSHHTDNSIDGGQKKYNQAKKEAVVNNGGVPVTDNNPGSTSKGNTPSTPYTPPTSDSGISVTPSTANGAVTIKTKLVGYSDGTCTLTITNGEKSTIQTATVIFAPNFSTCAGFTVPISTIGSGIWNIHLSVASGGTTTSKTTTYEVQ